MTHRRPRERQHVSYAGQLTTLSPSSHVGVVNSLVAAGVPPLVARQATRSFLDHLDRRDVAAAGIVSREHAGRLGLDVYVLWAQPIDLESEEQSRAMETVEGEHDAFSEALHPHVATFMDYVDPRTCGTLDAFDRALRTWAAEVPDGRVLMSAEHQTAVGAAGVRTGHD